MRPTTLPSRGPASRRRDFSVARQPAGGRAGALVFRGAARRAGALCCALAIGLAATIARAAEDEIFDRVERALSWSSATGTLRGHVSGLLDLEGYAFPAPAPALLEAGGHGLFAPRLTTFLDAQFGARVYVFAQARVDRGFDPANAPLRARLDEYAVRYTPSREAHVSVQVGKFATVVGSWVVRQLRALGRRVVVMHGHRHIDWVGICGPLTVISAPSPVMAKGDAYFHIHSLAADRDGALRLMGAERVDVETGASG